MQRNYANDGKCHNAEPGTYGHECGKQAEWIGTHPNGFRSGFCNACKLEGYEAKPITQWERAPQYMTPTQAEKNEWSRFANAAYSTSRNAIGHRYSVAASLPHDGQVTVAYFDTLQNGYRAWLSFNDFGPAERACERQRQ